MSMINDTAAVRPATSNRFAALLSGVSERIAQYRVYRTTLDELNSLSDRDLADLGISRMSIRSIAYEAAYGNA